MTRAVAALRTLAVAALLAAAGPAAGPAAAMATTPLTPGRIAFDDFMTGQIYAVNPDGTGLAQLTHYPQGIGGRFPDWSPDGSRILFARVKYPDFMGRIRNELPQLGKHGVEPLEQRVEGKAEAVKLVAVCRSGQQCIEFGVRRRGQLANHAGRLLRQVGHRLQAARDEESRYQSRQNECDGKYDESRAAKSR